ncbi:MAG TPA: Asp-tRNA(Asn)/Glu-tRNA(Gln) amidotransferase GatCAB subunit B, partial [Fibrella sp.]
MQTESNAVYTPTAQFEAVIGLEVHCQLLTQSKMFAADANAFGADPNTQVSVIT